MKIASVLLLALCASTARGSVVKGESHYSQFVGRQKSVSSSCLRNSASIVFAVPRGGGANRKVIAATIAGTLDALYGVPLALTPEKIGKDLYGAATDSLSPAGAISWINGNSGTTMYPYAIATFLSLYKKLPLHSVMAAMVAPLLLRSVQSLVTKKPQLVGYFTGVEGVNSVLLAVALFCNCKNLDFANQSLLIVGGWFIAQALGWFWNPSIFGTGEKWQNGELDFFVLRNYGNNLLRLGVMLASIGLGKDLLTSIGYSWIVCGLGIPLEFSITKDTEKLVPSGYAVIYFWNAILLTLGVILAF